MNASTSVRRLSILGTVALAVPIVAAAQRGNGAAAGAGLAAGHGGGFGTHTAGAAVVHAAPAGRIASTARVQSPRTARAGSAARMHTGVNPARAHRNFNNNFNGFTNDFDNVDFNDVPGLGFDFPHLAAISGGRRHFGRFFAGAPFFDGALLFGAPSVIIEQSPAEPQAPEAENAMENDASEAARHTRLRYEYRPPAPEPVVESAPEPPPAQYVFVRRDGTSVDAVGYSWDKDTLRYVTPDGMRHIISRDALDLSATQQRNEQRGLSFHAPA